ncbi:SMI1/KNR4 family protein [Vallitalea guaymasensis]|uniref:SMI1/KNR4 family protein n=1 Tax=Vallitalea guaymasensis TaxID=1185412 RepID=A0A8J8SBB8_9FIRM|nr:SMI1/KNR4 family protein [Vallitalea guaymasensis]QUH28552.1 SMI1/KNR4 family protein [Vallitalea guaymasensis]
MPKLRCICGYIFDLTPIPDEGYVVIRNYDYERYIEDEVFRDKSHLISKDSEECGKLIEADKLVVNLSGSLYECPDCGSLIWHRSNSTYSYYDLRVGRRAYKFDKLKAHSEENIGSGVELVRIRDLEKKLNVSLPEDFVAYLQEMNYAEIHGDPIYGIHNDMPSIDIAEQNIGKEHFRYGFLEIFCNDIDGTIFLRPDNGRIYNASFQEPIADSFKKFVEMLLM